jgi:hypothetical protein
MYCGVGWVVWRGNKLWRKMFKAAFATVLRAAYTVAAVKDEPRLPIGIALIKQFHALLDLTFHFNAAWFACSTTAFWCTWRPSEPTVSDENGFKVNRHVTTECIEHRRGQYLVTLFYLLWSKVGRVAGNAVLRVLGRPERGVKPSSRPRTPSRAERSTGRRPVL